MNSADDALALAGEFPPATRDRWMELVVGALTRGEAGQPPAEPDAVARLFDRRLVTRTLDDLAIGPLHTAEDAPRPASAAARSGTAGPWDVRVRVDLDGTDPGPGAAALVEELSTGATSVLLGLRQAPVVDVDVLDRALTGVLLDLASVNLDAGDQFGVAARALMALWERRGHPAAEVAGGFGADPLGEYARTGGRTPLQLALEVAVTLAQRCVEFYPRVQTLVVDSTPYHEAGGSTALEMGCGLATGVAYLRALTDAGLPIAAACAQLEFRLSVGADQFTGIAALRAARQCWARVAEVAGAPPDARRQRQHAVTSAAMTSRYDPWVNLLRTTVAGFAAGIGGASAVTVTPHDALLVAGGSELGRRLARNVSNILVDESHLARVADPAGGSWYVERLTADLAAAAWDWFTEIEVAGGMAAALGSGLVAERLETQWARRTERLSRRRDAMTGVSEFPDLHEISHAVVRSAEGTGAPGASAFPAVTPRRYPEVFEAQRARADRVAGERGERPSVYLATLGPLAAYSTRAGFAQNLFGTAGIRSVVGPPAGFVTSGLALACLCSSDELYAEQGEEAAAALKAAGAARIYLAGRPDDDSRRAALEAAGVDEFVFAGGDAVDVVRRALDLLEVT